MCVTFRLIGEGADANAMCRDSGATALMVSVAWQNGDLVEFFLSKGALPLIRDKEGRTPVHIAAANGSENILRLLLECNEVEQLVNTQVEVEETPEDYPQYYDSWVHQHESLLPEVSKRIC